MTNKDVLKIAIEQSAEDIGCKAEDFLADENRIVPLKLGANAKKYYKLPIGCNFISYGNNVVAAAVDETFEIVKEYISKFEFYHCFETPNIRWLNERIEPLGLTVCFMAEYYLPDLNRLTELPCEYEIRILEKGQFDELYVAEWSNALCADRKPLDMLAAGAYDDGKLIGLAGCSADAEAQRNCVSADIQACSGDTGARQGSVLLHCLVQCKVGEKCDQEWSYTRLGRDDGQTVAVSGRNEFMISLLPYI